MTTKSLKAWYAGDKEEKAVEIPLPESVFYEEEYKWQAIEKYIQNNKARFTPIYIEDCSECVFWIKKMPSGETYKQNILMRWEAKVTLLSSIEVTND